MNREPRILSRTVLRRDQQASDSSEDAYFRSMGAFQDAMLRRDFEEAHQAALTNLNFIGAFVQSHLTRDGALNFTSIPVLEQGGTVLAIRQDAAGLEQMRALVEADALLAPWRPRVARHLAAIRAVPRILQAVRQSPGCVQSDLKQVVVAPDGHLIANLVSWLIKAQELKAVRAGRTVRLYLRDVDLPVPRTTRRQAPILPAHKPLAPRLLDLDGVPQTSIPYPEVAPGDLVDAPSLEGPSRLDDRRLVATRGFVVSGSKATVASVEPLPLGHRPDPAFRRLFLSASGLFAVDDLANAAGLGNIPAAALYQGFTREIARTTAPLCYGAHLVSVHPHGHLLACVSDRGVLHTYDSRLSLHSEAIAANEERRVLDSGGGTNGSWHISGCSVARDASRYVIVARDHAWCFDRAHKPLWSVRMPEASWAMSYPGSGSVFDRSVHAAAELLGLSIPFAPDERRRRFKSCLRQVHPDVRPYDPVANQETRNVIAANELLRQVEGRAIGDARPIECTVAGPDSLVATCFRSAGYGVYLASHSGKLIRLDEEGQLQDVFHLGTHLASQTQGNRHVQGVASELVEAADSLYMRVKRHRVGFGLSKAADVITVRDSSPKNRIPIPEGGEMLAAACGVGVMERKRVRFFDPDGRWLSTLVTHDPLDWSIVAVRRWSQRRADSAQSCWEWPPGVESSRTKSYAP